MRGFGARRSLRGKLVLLVVVTTTAALFMLSAVHVISMRELAKANALQKLQLVSEADGTRLATVFDGMRTDAQILAGLPPIDGIARTTWAPRTIDPVDGSSLDLWRDRLKTIFESVLSGRPHYTQIRFIGRANDWRELVRVNQSGGVREVVPDAELQSKGGEPYLEGIEGIAGDGHYFSQVTLNRERGQTDGPPTIRIIQPVFEASGALFGVIVINAEFEALLRLGAPNVAPGASVKAVTSHGDYMVFEGPGETSRLVFHTEPDWVTPVREELTAGAAPGGLVLMEDRAIHARPIEIASGRMPFGLTLVTEVPNGILYADADRTLARDVLLSLILVALAGLGAHRAGGMLTRPLAMLAHEVRDRRDPLHPISPPVAVDDEVGDVARTLADLSNGLIRETSKVRAIFAAAANAIVVVDTEGIMREVNPAMAALFGYTPEEMIGADMSILMPPKIGAVHHHNIARFHASAQESVVHQEISGIRKDGSAVPLEISISRVRLAEGSHLIGILRDISERKAAEQRVAGLIGELERSNAELDQFAYVASHDLKAPLRAIDNAAQWLAEDLESHLTDDTRESLGILRGRVRRMERLLADLLEHSRIGRTAKPAPLVDGTTLVEDVVSLLEIPPGFVLNVSPAMADIVLPRMPIGTVLLNLVSNAIVHHDRTEGRIDIDAEDLGDALEFTVSDDGPGIQPQFHGKVFELFRTLKPRDELEASGMGLAMVKKHLDLAGGRISLVSDGQRGTTFRVLWPKTPASAQGREKLAS